MKNIRYPINSNLVVEQAAKLQDHLRGKNVRQLELGDLGAVIIALKCGRQNWASWLTERSREFENLIPTINDYRSTNATTICGYPMQAMQFLVAAELTPVSPLDTTYTDFCKLTNLPQNSISQALYFILPFTEKKMDFLCNESFNKWMEAIAPGRDHEVMMDSIAEFAADITNTETYAGSVSSIFRKLKLDYSQHITSEKIEKCGLHAIRPPVAGETFELRVELDNLCQKMEKVQIRTDLTKVPEYEQKRAEFIPLISDLTAKQSHVQKAVDSANHLIQTMLANQISDNVILAKYATEFEQLEKFINRKQQLVASPLKMKPNGHFWAYEYVVPRTPLDNLTTLEPVILRMRQVKTVLELYLAK